MIRWLAGFFILVSVFILNTHAAAESFDWGDISGKWDSKFTVGAHWRTSDIDYDLVGKVNVPGQQSICDASNAQGRPLAGCSLNHGDLRAASGSYFLNGDNGNRSYDKGDLVAAIAKLRADVSFSWEDFSLSAQGFVVYDDVAMRGYMRNTNNYSNGGFQPERVPYSAEYTDELGFEGKLEAYNLSWAGELFNTDVFAAVGAQRVGWGESLTIIPHSLNNINAPDLVRINTPGFEPSELYDPVELFNVGVTLSDNLDLSGIYQLNWRPVRTPPAGSFYSTVDLAGAGASYVVLGLGNNREAATNLNDLPPMQAANPEDFTRSCLFDTSDPHGASNQGAHRGDLSNSAELANAYTQGRTVCRVSDREPSDEGQLGFKLSYFAEWLNETQFAFYYMRYHSRFPYFSLYGAQDPVIPDTSALAPVNSLATSIGVTDTDALIRLVGALKVVDTIRYTMTYPEDIDLYGLSFNTVLGDVSVSGEFSYRPNMPLQVYGVDLIFMGLANAFDRSRCIAAPSFIEAHRNGPRGDNCDAPPPAAGEFIPGWERHELMQGVLSFINAEASGNPFGADRWLQVLELGITHVADMPDDGAYYLQGVGLQTHPSIGRDEVDRDDNNARDTDQGGSNSGVDVEVIAMQNPTRQTKGFPSASSWGYRLINVLEYKNLFSGVNLQARLLWFHDVNGYSPGPGQNFVEGRKRATLSGSFDYSRWNVTAGYTWHFGGEPFNDVRDRDTATFAVSYSY